MKTVIEKYTDDEGNVSLDLNDKLAEKALKSLAFNNTFMPNIEHVIYNLKTTDKVDGKIVEIASPVLTTTVFFKDGTKVVVKNSCHDKIDVEDTLVSLSDGSTTKAKTASRASREIGLVYAVIKRLLGRPDANGHITETKLASFLSSNITNAWNQSVEVARLKAEKVVKARKQAEIKKTADTNKATATKTTEKLTEDELRSVVNAVVAGFKKALEK